MANVQVRLPQLPTRLPFRAELPFGSSFTARGVKMDYSPRIIPEQPSKAVITGDEQLFELASLPGLKIVLVPNPAHVSRCLAYTFSAALDRYIPTKEGKDAAILATGGTWDGPRMLMGTPEYAKEVFGISLPTDKGVKFSCLDEYGYDRISLEALYKRVGDRASFINARQNPVLYGDLHRLFLFGAGFAEKDFRFPPAGFEVPGTEAGREWRSVLLDEIYPAVVSAHGIGSYPFHDAFNDFSDFDTLSGFFGIAGSTKLQNGNDTTPYGWKQMSLMFRNIAAAFRISEPEMVFNKAMELRSGTFGMVPRELSYYVGRAEWQNFIDNLPDEIATARETIGRMPTNVISQGLGDLIRGGLSGKGSADLHVFGVSGGQKANAFKYCFCSPADESNPASAANFYLGKTIVFVDHLAAHHAGDFVGTFWRYEPPLEKQSKISERCKSGVISQKFWEAREADPGRENWADS